MATPTILDKIIADKKVEVDLAKKKSPVSIVKALAEEQDPPRGFGEALLPMSDNPVRIIAECKRKSPSKGLLKDPYDPVSIACAYERGGAAAISVLTDEVYFGGRLEDLRVVKQSISLPVLRKDFIIDEYQIYQARAYGADSFLLLSGVLDLAKLQYLIEVGRELSMEPLVESHTAGELDQALKTDAKILGINNRNLGTFAVDLDHSKELFKQASSDGQGRVIVCESGIKGREDIVKMCQVGYKAFLVGEALVTKPDSEQAMKELLHS